MKLFKTSPSKIATLIASVAFLGLASQNAAALTPSGTPIDNTASLTYVVGTATQPAVASSPFGNTTPGTAGTPTSFLVDNKVDFTLTAVTPASVTANQVGNPLLVGTQNAGSGTILTYQLANNGNTAQGFNLAATNVATGIAAPTGTADIFNPTGFVTYVVLDAVPGTATAVFDPAVALPASAIATLAPGQTATVFVFSTIPAVTATAAGALTTTVLANANQALVTLTATVLASGAPGFNQVTNAATPAAVGSVAPTVAATGAVVAGVATPATTAQIVAAPAAVGTPLAQTVTTAAQNATGGTAVGAVDVVFAEVANTALGVTTLAGNGTASTLLNNGAAAANNVYTVNSAVLSVQKVSSVICDPAVGGASATVFPSNIPGAAVQWAITIKNLAIDPVTGAALTTAANLSSATALTDPLNINTLFDPNLVTVTTAASPAACLSGTTGAAPAVGVATQLTSAAGVAGVLTAAPAGAVTLGAATPTSSATVNVGFANILPLGMLAAGESITVFFNVFVK